MRRQSPSGNTPSRAGKSGSRLGSCNMQPLGIALAPVSPTQAVAPIAPPVVTEMSPDTMACTLDTDHAWVPKFDQSRMVRLPREPDTGLFPVSQCIYLMGNFSQAGAYDKFCRLKKAGKPSHGAMQAEIDKQQIVMRTPKEGGNQAWYATWVGLQAVIAECKKSMQRGNQSKEHRKAGIWLAKHLPPVTVTCHGCQADYTIDFQDMVNKDAELTSLVDKSWRNFYLDVAVVDKSHGEPVACIEVLKSSKITSSKRKALDESKMPWCEITLASLEEFHRGIPIKACRGSLCHECMQSSAAVALSPAVCPQEEGVFQNISQALNDMEHVEELTKKVTALEQGQATLQRQMKRLLDVFAHYQPLSKRQCFK